MSHCQWPPFQAGQFPMNLAASKLLRSFPPRFTSCCLSTQIVQPLKTGKSKRSVERSSRVARVSASELAELKENWLDSLSCPFPPQPPPPNSVEGTDNNAGKWVIGIDPDVSGALALLKDDHTAEVFDTPHLQVMVGKRVRKRLDARSISQLLHSFNAPIGMTAYIEQSTPIPQDGKQGWYNSGFTYGLWLGILVSSGFSVVPVCSRVWKDQFQLYGNLSSKDDSRKAAAELFPSLSSSLKRKKDHGRAEALLIAAYGKGLRLQPKSCTTAAATSSSELSFESCSLHEQ